MIKGRLLIGTGKHLHSAYCIAYLLHNTPQGVTVFLEDRYNKNNKEKEEKTGRSPTTSAVINQE